MPLLGTRGAAAAKGFGLTSDSKTNNDLIIGQAYGGGYFFGVIKDGANLYNLVISPKAQGESSRIHKTTSPLTDSPYSVTDGWTNTVTVASAAYPAAQWARSLTINGFNDWYIAARDEMELMYRNLKPVTNANTTGNRTYTTQQGDTVFTVGNNQNSVPIGAAYTADDPSITPLTLFQTGGAEAIAVGTGSFAMCTSTRYAGNTTSMLFQGMDNGRQTVATGWNAALPVRVIRRVLKGPA